MNRYETMFIVKPTLTDEETEQVLGQISQEINKLGGKILTQKIMGKKPLSYEIKKQKEGLYVLIYFDMNSANVKKLERRLKLIQSIIRYLMIRADGEDVEAAEAAEEKTVEAAAADTASVETAEVESAEPEAEPVEEAAEEPAEETAEETAGNDDSGEEDKTQEANISE